jgi:hypothetical protein
MDFKTIKENQILKVMKTKIQIIIMLKSEFTISIQPNKGNFK